MSLNNKDRLIFTYVAANDAQYGDIYESEEKTRAFTQFSKDNPNVAFLLDNPGDIWKNGHLYASYSRAIDYTDKKFSGVNDIVDDIINPKIATVNNTINDISTTLSKKAFYGDVYDVVLNDAITVREVYMSDIASEIPQDAPDGYYIAGTQSDASLYEKVDGTVTKVPVKANTMYRVSKDAHYWPGFYAICAYTVQNKQAMDTKYDNGETSGETPVESGVWVFLQGDVATTNVTIETVAYTDDIRSYIMNSDNEELKRQLPYENYQSTSGTILNLIIGGDQPNYLVIYAGGTYVLTASHVISSAADIQRGRTFDGEVSTNVLNKILCVNSESTTYVGRTITFNSSAPENNPIAGSQTSSFNLYAPNVPTQSSPYMIALPKSSGTLITDSDATVQYIPWNHTVYSVTGTKNPCKIVSRENGQHNAAVPYIDTAFNMNIGNSITMYENEKTTAKSVTLTMPNSSGRIITSSDIQDVAQYRDADSDSKYYVVGHASGDNTHIYSSDNNAPYMVGNVLYYSSDARRKENIKPLSDVLLSYDVNADIIKSFEYKDTHKRAYGFIAQELKEILPETVHFDGVSYAVDYNSALSAMVGILMKRVEHQQHEIDELKKMLNR